MYPVATFARMRENGEHPHSGECGYGEKGPVMLNPVHIENIQEMRRQEGIDDVELREEVRGLAVGDLVRVTLLPGTGPSAAETLRVQITAITGDTFRGKLVSRPRSAGLEQLGVGSLIVFSAAHIHS